ncbi:short-chain dehydrogenase [Streptomyces longispororuber]|uniref:Short-chain dehydrogenase n=2 Tax=Streptomyces longispororuber TaxID=68230 RepID=A0A919DPP5_9ACTN|nr:short-chain dehydrogenase [Streptomyces longispororuber]
MSVAHRFGREGYAVALVSRTDTRHAGYLASLAAAGVDATAHVADVRDHASLMSALDTIAEHHGSIDFVHYGPSAVGPDALPTAITEADAASVRTAMSWVYPAVDVVAKVLPGMRERGSGGFLFASGISAVRPMPVLGSLAVSAAALRHYALTLNAGLEGSGVYAGALIIGGVVERGDIHRMVTARPEEFGEVGAGTLDSDDLADTAWGLHAERDRPEAVVPAFG